MSDTCFKLNELLKKHLASNLNRFKLFRDAQTFLPVAVVPCLRESREYLPNHYKTVVIYRT